MTAERLTVPALIAPLGRPSSPTRQFLVADDATLTYGELDRATQSRRRRGSRRDGVVKGTRVGVLMPNGAGWAVAALALARARCRRRAAQHPPPPAGARKPAPRRGRRAAARLQTFRGRRYLDDLREISPALAPQPGPLFDRTLPRLRAIDVWPDDSPIGRCAASSGDQTRRRRAGSRGAAGGRSRHRVHVGQPRHAQGRDPHARRRSRRDRGGPRRALRHARRPALHPDALLLGRRLRDRSAVGARRRRDARERGPARTGAHARAAGARAGHAVPGLARPGRRARRPSRVRDHRPRRAAAGEPAVGPPVARGAGAAAPRCSG